MNTIEQNGWTKEYSSEDLQNRVARRLLNPALVAIELDI